MESIFKDACLNLINNKIFPFAFNFDGMVVSIFIDSGTTNDRQFSSSKNCNKTSLERTISLDIQTNNSCKHLLNIISS